MSGFYSLKVSEVTQQTKDCVAISFDVPQLLKDKFIYLPGQYLTLKLHVNGEEIRRSYSVCSSPLMDEKITVAIKKVKEGRGSTYINEKVKAGDVIEVMVPMGNFHTPLLATNKINYVLFAGGSGITPMMSIIKSVLKAEPQSTLTLFYGNEEEAAIIFKSQLDELVDGASNRLSVYHIINKPSITIDATFKGIMNVEKNKMLLSKFIDTKAANEYFICGPTGMMDSVVTALQESNVPKEKIHVEYFTAPVSNEKTDSTLGFVASQVTVICDGDEVVIQLKPEETVLEGALAAGLDAPYACQGGSCCTCRAKLIEGKVHMKVNYALLESEVKEGFILTCQSQALTPTLIVDYDRGR